MSQPSVIWWQPSTGNEAQIATLQDIAQDNYVVLNSESHETRGTYIYDKMIRSIVINSPDNIAAARFIVSGIGSPVDGDGNPTQILSPITEIITGVNGAPGVESVNIYSQINSILVTTAPATNVKVGFGRFGITDYVFFDYNRMSSEFSSISLQFVNQTSIMAGVFMSLNKPESPNIAQSGILEPFGTENGEYITFIPAFALIGMDTTNQTTQIAGAISVCWATVQQTSIVVADSVYFTFVQQGIKS